MKVESMNPVVRQLSQYATDKMIAAMSGNYKDFKNAYENGLKNGNYIWN